jgi:hypothetical protein
MKRVYISGPITGMRDKNRKAFAKAAEVLRKTLNVDTVINPHDIVLEGSPTWEDYMKADLREMLTCDTVVMLDGWGEGRGATLEEYVARQLGMRVIWMWQIERMLTARAETLEQLLEEWAQERVRLGTK